MFLFRIVQVEVEFFRSQDPTKNDKFDYVFNQVEEGVPQPNAGDNTENVDLPDLDLPYQASEEIVASNEEEVEEENSTETNEAQNEVEEYVTEDPNLAQGIPIDDGNNLGDKLRYNSVNQLSSLVRRILF